MARDEADRSETEPDAGGPTRRDPTAPPDDAAPAANADADADLAGDADPVLLEFLAEYALDRERGLQLPLLHYLSRFPGHEEAVAKEYLGLQQGTERPRDRIGPYRLMAELGRGGQGTVWLARDERVGRNIALKVLHAGLRSAISPERLRREAQLTARIDHPGIDTVFDIGEDHGHLWLATRYVPGPSLATLLQRARQRAEHRGVPPSCVDLPGVDFDVPEPERVRAVLTAIEQVALALHAAHGAGVIHRDVKPGNLLVPAQGPPVLVDFGLARALAAGGAFVTQPGELLGTPAYMAPERLRPASSCAAAAAEAGRELDPGVDLWGLAVVLFECLTLQLPFRGDTAAELEVAHRRPPPLLPTLGHRQLSRDLDVVVQAALAPDVDDRYRDAAAFAADLRRVGLGLPPRIRRPSPWLRAVRFCRAHPWPCAAALLVLLGLVLALVVVDGMRQEATQATNAASARAADLRRLSRRLVFDLHDAVRELPGATEVSEQLLAAGLEYLDLLRREAQDAELGALLREDVAQTHLLVGDVLGNPRQSNLGRPLAARRHYQLALDLLPATGGDAGPTGLRAGCLLRLGELDQRAGAPERARRTWTAALALLATAPTSAPLVLQQAQLHLRLAELLGPITPPAAFTALDQARACLDRVRGAEPDLVDLDLWSATAWLLRARLHLDRGERELAAAAADAADRLLQELPVLHDHERRAHRLRIATDALRARTDTDPIAQATLLAAATTASTALRTADPRDEDAARLDLQCAFDRAGLALDLGDPGRALELRARAHELAERGADAYGADWAVELVRAADHRLGLAAARRGHHAVAAALFAQALSRVPPDADGDALLTALAAQLRWRLGAAVLAQR
ncbi:MAG: protein kinase [Planctomycetota bacterium]